MRQRISAFARGREHFYVIPDYCDEEDARRIVKIFGTLPVLSGGSGILQELGERMAGGKAENVIAWGMGKVGRMAQRPKRQGTAQRKSLLRRSRPCPQPARP